MSPPDDTGDLEQEGDGEEAGAAPKSADSEDAQPASAPWYHRLFDVSSARGRFAATVAAGLAVIALAPLVTSLPSVPVKAVHWTYLFVSGEKEEANLEDAVKGRPIWQRTPSLLGKSFDYATGSQHGQLAETDGTAIRQHSIAELAAKAVEFDGVPTEFVGRATSEATISTDILAPLGVEYMLTGAKGVPVAYLGVAPDNTPAFSFSAGDVVLIRGVVVASGVARAVGGSPREAIYVVGLDSSQVGTERVEEHGRLATLAKEAREGG
jgi:hypothetical protein